MDSQNGFKERLRQYAPLIKVALKILIGLALLGLLVMLIFVLSIRLGAYGPIPSKSELANIKNDVASEVYSEDGVLLGKYFVQNRTNVSLEATSPHVVDALIATEDARFYEHGGVDFWSLMRVLIKTIIGGDERAGGGSTLSQQLAKNLYGRKYSMPVNKVREMLIAQRLEKVYSKKELLTLYLNTVSFGENVYGIEVAAERFFNKEPHKLRIEEAAVLVGILKATTYYNPRIHPERALDRRNTVLDQMHANNKIGHNQTDSLKTLPLNLDYHLISKNVGLAPYFREHIRIQLEDWCEAHNKPDGTPYNLYTDGLKIHTTLNSKMQGYAESAVKEHLADLQKSFDAHWKGGKPWGNDAIIEKAKKKTRRYKKLKEDGFSEKEINKIFNTSINMVVFDQSKGQVKKKMSPMDSLRYYHTILNAGFMVSDPKTGNVKAWVGGNNFKYFQYDHVRSKRQVGSIFKPIVYAAALQKGIGPCDYFHNRFVTYSEYDDWTPRNSDGKYGDMFSMAGGLSKSINSVAVNIMMQTGIDNVIGLARKFGIDSDIPEVPSIALGTASISLYEMMQVYGTLANKGVRNTPKYLVKVTDANGRVLGDFVPKTLKGDTMRVIKEVEAAIMTGMLEQVVDSGTAKRLHWKYGLDNDMAGKTGTTQSHADGWFMGYTPNLVAGVWVGADNPHVHFRDISLGQGANMALPIWAKFMKKTYANSKFASMQRDTFPALSEDLAVVAECVPRITEEEYYVMQNGELEIEVEEDPDNQFSLEDILNDLEKSMENRKPSKPKPPHISKAEKDAKKRERKRKREERKRKRKEFFKEFFNN